MSPSGFRTWSRSCLTMQGYGPLSGDQRRQLWLGLRFAPILCFTGVAVGTILGSPAVLLAIAATALLGGFVTRKHPFDWVYDGTVRRALGGPPVPDSPPPRRFACQLATPWIVAVAIAFAAGAPTLAWGLAVPFLLVSATVATTNFCIPSLIYGLIHRRSEATA
ncbi:MAG TPA: DUF4395 family protein [Solirubrobacterales bacterium]|nr:DUF4395 family protein [Solirubrobacterales bacterium]